MRAQLHILYSITLKINLALGRLYDNILHKEGYISFKKIENVRNAMICMTKCKKQKLFLVLQQRTG